MNVAEMYYTDTGAFGNKAELEDSLYRNINTSFEAVDNFGYQGIAWRTKDVHEGTYLFMCYETNNADDFLAGQSDEHYAYFSRKLESELKRIDEEIREGARQVSTLGILE